VYKEFKEGAKRILVATDLVSPGRQRRLCNPLPRTLCGGSHLLESCACAWVDSRGVVVPPPVTLPCLRKTLGAAQQSVRALRATILTFCACPCRLPWQVGRGIDIERVNIVINYDMPETGGWPAHVLVSGLCVPQPL
jgi:superfamily II DNA/RNA helicase